MNEYSRKALIRAMCILKTLTKIKVFCIYKVLSFQWSSQLLESLKRNRKVSVKVLIMLEMYLKEEVQKLFPLNIENK